MGRIVTFHWLLCCAAVLGWGLLQAVPSCLTVGEACLISQTLVLLGWRMVLSLPALLILLPDMLMGELGSQPEHVVLVVKVAQQMTSLPNSPCDMHH